MSEKKSNRPPNIASVDRRPREKYSFTDMAREVSEETGWREADIKKVWQLGCKKYQKAVLENKQVRIPRLGIVSAIVTNRAAGKVFDQPGVKGSTYTQQEKTYKWKAHFLSNLSLKRALEERVVTEEDKERIKYKEDV